MNSASWLPPNMLGIVLQNLPVVNKEWGQKSNSIIFLLNILCSKNSKIVWNSNCYHNKYFKKYPDVSSNKLHFIKWLKKREKGIWKRYQKVQAFTQHLRLRSRAYFVMIRALYDDFITKPQKDFQIRKKKVMNWFLIQLVTLADLSISSP